MSGATLRSEQEAAVVDVGSNSVRLVIYRIDGRAMTPILNEKVMAGLGRDLSQTGALNEAGVETAIRALKRFLTLIEARNIGSVFPVATAAVRDAADGPEFVARARAEAGIALRVLSGAEEAQLSALGVTGGVPDADGVVGDLGGASLELVEVGPGVGPGETFALGPLALASDAGFDYDFVAGRAAKLLSRSAVLSRHGRDFYAVGGAWRALGRIDMGQRNHPLRVLHQHVIARADALRLIEVVRKLSKKSLERLEEAAAKRADALPYAAAVLEQVLLAGGFERVVLSAFGLREGVLLERMSAQALQADPLIAAAEALAGRWSQTHAFGAALEQWIAPLFAAAPPAFSPKRDAVLRGAGARLADIGAPLHPDQRLEILFDMILRAPLAAISHEERAFLAAAIHHRYTKAPPGEERAYDRLLGGEQRAAAAALGAALRFGADLCGRSEELLSAFSLDVEGGVIRLAGGARAAHIITETVQRRLEYAAACLGLRAQISVA